MLGKILGKLRVHVILITHFVMEFQNKSLFTATSLAISRVMLFSRTN